MQEYLTASTTIASDNELISQILGLCLNFKAQTTTDASNDTLAWRRTVQDDLWLLLVSQLPAKRGAMVRLDRVQKVWILAVCCASAFQSLRPSPAKKGDWSFSAVIRKIFDLYAGDTTVTQRL